MCGVGKSDRRSMPRHGSAGHKIARTVVANAHLSALSASSPQGALVRFQPTRDYSRIAEKVRHVDRIAQRRGDLEFDLSSHTPRIDGDPAGIFIEEHVVMMEVAVQKADVALCRTQLAEQLFRPRHMARWHEVPARVAKR